MNNECRTLSKISRRDLSTVILLASIILIISTIPYCYVLWKTPPDMQFTGWLGSPADHNCSLSRIRQAIEGFWLFENRYTTEPHFRGMIRPYWLFIGKLSGLTKISPIIIYHLTRLFFSFLLMMVVYKFLSIFFLNKAMKIVAFLLIFLSSGFGWMFALSSFLRGGTIKFCSVDLFVPEATTFKAIHQNAHLAVSLILILLVFVLMYSSFNNDRIKPSIYAGLVGFLLAFVHPFDMPSIYLTLFFYIIFLSYKEGKVYIPKIKAFLFMVFISIVPILYNYYFVLFDPVVKEWHKQNVLPSPNPLGYISGFGFIFFFSLIGLAHAIQRRKKTDIFLIAWVISISMLLYSPIKVQVKMVMGLHIPLSILSTIGLFILFKKLRKVYSIRYNRRSFKKIRFIILSIFILSTTPTNIALLLNDMFFHIHADPFPVYIHKDKIEAFKWLQRNTQSSEAVLSSYQTGNFIPGWSGNKVFIGHWAETINTSEKFKLLNLFFQSENDQIRKNILATYNIKYLFYGPEEQRLGHFNPFNELYLLEVFKNPRVSIFQVKDGV